MTLDGAREHALGATGAYEDRTEDFWASTQALGQEQVVYAPGFSLQRLMNALEVMDPNMDGGMAYPLHLVDEKDREGTSRPFDVRDALSADELCFLLDRLLACELAWMEGAALGQTLYTCIYYHEYVVAGVSASDHWSHAALSLFLLATAKCCALQWHELMRQRVYDGEDFNGDLGSVALPDGVETNLILTQLDAMHRRIALEAPQDASSIGARLAFQRAWLACLASLCKDVPDGVYAGIQLESCLKQWKLLKPGAETLPHSSIAPLGEPHLCNAPPGALGYFDVTLSRTYSSHIPMRPLALPRAEQVWQRWDTILRTDMRLVLRVVSSDQVMQWLTLLSHAALAFQTHQVVPFARSLVQTCMSDGRTSASGTRDLEHVALCAIESLSGVSMQDVLVRLEWFQQREPTSTIATRTLRFVRTFSGLLVQLLSALAMNRSRQKRMLAKAYTAWADLADDAAQLGGDIERALTPSRFPASILPLSVHFFALFQQMHILGAGFDLELYAPPERGAMYFCLAQTLEEQREVCMSLLTTLSPTPSYARPLQRWASLAHAQSKLAHVYTMLYLGAYGERALRSDSDAAYAEAAFARRIKWLRRPAWSPPASLRVLHRSEDPHSIAAVWAEWVEFARTYLAEAPAERVARIRAHLAACARRVHAAQERRTLDVWTHLCPHECVAADQGLATLCADLDAYVQAHPVLDSVRFEPSGHPWFPQVN